MLRKHSRLRRPLRQRWRFLLGALVAAAVLAVIPVLYWPELSESEQTVLVALLVPLGLLGAWWAWDESGRDRG